MDIGWNKIEFEACCWEGPDYVVSVDYGSLNTIIIFDGPGRTLNKAEAELIAQVLNANRGMLQRITTTLITRAALAESESAPKVTVNLPDDRTCTLHGAEAEQFMIDHGLENTEPGSHIDIGLSAPAGGK